MSKLRPVFLFSLFALLFSACVVVDSDPSPNANFQASSLEVEVGEVVRFTDRSTNNPTSFFWEFEGGNPATSSQSDVSVTYSKAGTYNVTLTAGNASGDDTERQIDYITVVDSDIAITIVNNTFTPLKVLLAGNIATIASNEAYVFEGIEAFSTVAFSASTASYDTEGNVIGDLLNWSENFELTGEDEEIGINVNSNFFFLDVQNNGGTLRGLYVNDGTVAEKFENLIFNGDGSTNHVGYFEAYNDTRIRCNFDDNQAEWIIWENQDYFTFPMTDNQSILVVNNLAKKRQSVPNKAQVKTSPVRYMLPATPTKKKHSVSKATRQLYNL